MICGSTRTLVVAAGTGLMVSLVTGFEAAGWLAAVLAGGAVLALEGRALRRGASTCTVPTHDREHADT